jgi:hypothetical protein
MRRLLQKLYIQVGKEQWLSFYFSLSNKRRIFYLYNSRNNTGAKDNYQIVGLMGIDIKLG